MKQEQIHVPVVGEKVTLVHYTGFERPYTVVSVSANGKKCVIREAGLIFGGPCYYDSKPDHIYDNVNGKTKNCYVNKWGYWHVSKDKYYYLSWGRWDYEPYLD